MTWKQKLEQMRAQIRGHVGVIEELQGKFDAGTANADEQTRYQTAVEAAEGIRNSKEFKDLVETEKRSLQGSGLISFAAGAGQARSSGAGSGVAAGGGTPPGDGDGDEASRASYGRQIRSGQPGGAVSHSRSNFQGGTPDRPSDAPSLRTSHNFAKRGIDPAAYHDAQVAWLRYGKDGMSQEQQRTLAAGACNDRGELRNTNNVTFGPDGAFLLSPIMSGQVLQGQRAYFGVVDLGAEVIVSGSGAEALFPTTDDTSRRAQVVGEGVDDSTNRARFAYGLTRIDAFKYATPTFVLTREHLEDTSFDVEGITTRNLTNALANAQAEDLITGDGINKPLGLITALAAGISGGANFFRRQTAASGTITADDFLALINNVGDLYKASPSCRFGISPGTLYGAVMAMKGQGGEYLFRNANAGEPTNIHGRPYSFASYMTSATGLTSQTSGANIATYGDHSCYKVRLVRDIAIRRFDQVAEAANVDGVAFKAFQRMGGALVHPGTNAQSRMLSFLQVQ